MKFTFLTLFTFLLFTAQSQFYLPGKHAGRSSTSGAFGARFTAGMVHGDGATLLGAGLEPGIAFSNGFMVQFCFGYLENYHQANRLGLRLQAGTASIHVSKRLLRPNNVLSPALALTTGGYFLSRVNRQTETQKTFFIAEDDLLNNLHKMYGFTRVSYLMDIRLKELHIQIGPNYTGYLSRQNTLDQSLRFFHGWGLEIGVIQTW